MIETKFHPVNLNNGYIRYRKQIVLDPSPPDGPLRYALRKEFFINLASMPSMSDVGPTPYQKLVLQHNGTAWVITFEAEAEEPDGYQSQSPISASAKT